MSTATSRDDATYERVAEAIDGAQTPRLLPRDPAVPLRTRRRRARRCGPDQVRARRRREAVRPRPRLGDRARRRAAPVHRRVAALPDRPLPREDGPRGDPLPPVREHDARAGLEPELRRVRPDHDGRGLRRRGPRPLLRPGRRAARRRRQPPDAGRRYDRDGAAGRRRLEDAQGRPGRALPSDRRGRPGALRARPVRRLPRHRRRRARLDDRDVRRAAARDRQLALVGRAVLHPHRQAPAGDADRAAARVQASAPTRLCDPEPSSGAEPARDQARSVDRRPARPRRAPRGRRGHRRGDPARRGVRRAGRARARRRTRCCCTPR